jgi:hypothetical protein
MGVCSQGRRVTGGDEGAKRRWFGRCRVSAGMVGQAPEPAEALGAYPALLTVDTRVRRLDHQGVWRGRLNTMVDNIDR